MLPPTVLIPLELGTNACVCVCVTADANSIVLISSVMRYDKCGDGSDLEKKVTSGSYRIKADKNLHFPGIYLSRSWIWI